MAALLATAERIGRDLPARASRGRHRPRSARRRADRGRHLPRGPGGAGGRPLARRPPRRPSGCTSRSRRPSRRSRSWMRRRLVDRPGIAEWPPAGETGVYGHPVPGVGYKVAFDAGSEGWDPDVEAWAPDAAEEARHPRVAGAPDAVRRAGGEPDPAASVDDDARRRLHRGPLGPAGRRGRLLGARVQVRPGPRAARRRHRRGRSGARPVPDRTGRAWRRPSASATAPISR